jgi:hypothetical protein
MKRAGRRGTKRRVRLQSGNRSGRVNRHLVTVFQPVRKPDPRAVHGHRGDLGVRDAEGLDRILDGGAIAEGRRKGNVTARKGQKIVQIFTKSESHGYHGISIDTSSYPFRALPKGPAGRNFPIEYL